MILIDIDQLRAILEVDEGYPIGSVCALAWNDTVLLALALTRVN